MELNIKGRILGRQAPLICAPLIGETHEEVLEEARWALDYSPDCVEWRADYFAGDYVETLREVKEILLNMPLIFTLRMKQEGGFKDIGMDERLEIICRVIRTGLAEIADIELCNGSAFINTVLKSAKENNVYTIISSHNFQATPGLTDMLQILDNEREAGADIVKLAVMPNTPGDVLSLLEASTIFTSKYDTPAITISMGRLGTISRIGGNVFGSAVSFGSLSRESAPGQIAVPELKRIFGILK